jgi:hypothetical protein
MPAEAVYWLYKKNRGCRLLAGKGSGFEVIHEYPAEVYSLLRDRAGLGLAARLRGGGAMAVVSDRSNARLTPLRVSSLEAADGGLLRIRRLPVFSQEVFESSYPEASRLTAEVKGLFEEHRRLVVGGPDRLLIKQVCYSVLLGCSQPADFPPVFFLECEADIYLPEAVQISAQELDLGAFLGTPGGEAAPFAFYEASSREAESAAAWLADLSSGKSKNLILCLGSDSAKAMRETLTQDRDRLPAGFRAVFIEASRLTAIG